MSSESVWFEQVDSALKSYLGDLLAPVFQKIPIVIKKPDEDFKTESYPCVTIYNLFSSKDVERLNNLEDVTVSIDVENKKIKQELSAIPYVLYYQIDFWTKTIKDMNSMTRVWVENNPSLNFTLKAVDLSGNDRYCNVMLQGGINKADNLVSSQRVFRSFFTLKVWVEVDGNIPTESPMITSIDFPDTVVNK